jgi:hypothetical protein
MCQLGTELYRLHRGVDDTVGLRVTGIPTARGRDVKGLAETRIWASL